MNSSKIHRANEYSSPYEPLNTIFNNFRNIRKKYIISREHIREILNMNNWKLRNFCKSLWKKIVRFHKFWNGYMQIYLRFKSCILVADGGTWGPKYVAFIYDIIKKFFCVFNGNMYANINMSQHNRVDSIKRWGGCKIFRVQSSCKADTLLVDHIPWYESPGLVVRQCITLMLFISVIFKTWL